MKLYRELQLLLQLYRNAVGLYALPAFLGVATAVVTISLYGAVRFYGKMPFKLYLSFIIPSVALNVMLAFLFQPAATIQKESRKMKNQILNRLISRRVNNDHTGHAVVKSLPTLGIKVGSVFMMERSTHLRVLCLVSVNAVTLLITL